MLFSLAHSIPVTYSQSVLWRFSGGDLVCWISEREEASVWQMFDTWNPAGPLAEWNQDKSMQSCRCLGEMGTKGHSLSACLPRAPGKASAPGLLLHAWSGRQMSDLTSAALPWGPYRCLTKQPGSSAFCELDRGECDECLGSLAGEGSEQPGSCVQCQAPQKPPVTFC